MQPAGPNSEILGPRDVVTIEGPDAASYLQSQVSQDLNGQQIGEPRWTFVLDPAGKVDALARVVRTGDKRFELDIDAGFGEVLRARLERFKIRVDAALSLTEAATTAPGPSAEAERVVAGWPRMGAEIIPGETLPAGLGLSALAISFTKGCYPGQELVERMDSRAADAPRSLRRVELAAGSTPGDPLVVDGVEVGIVTSVAGDRGLAWVKRNADVGDPIAF